MHLINVPILSIFLLVNCNGSVNNTTKKSPIAISPTAAATIPIAQLLPIARITTTLENNTVIHCSGFLYQNQQVITAAHCFQYIKNNSCKQSITVEWLYNNTNTDSLELSGVKALCQNAKIFQNNADSAQTDIAVITLQTNSVYPTGALTFNETSKALNTEVVLWGNANNTTTYALSQHTGYISNTTPSFTHNAGSAAGFSGTPVFILNSAVAATNKTDIKTIFNTGVAGIQQGTLGEMPFAIDSLKIKQLITQVPTTNY